MSPDGEVLFGGDYGLGRIGAFRYDPGGEDFCLLWSTPTGLPSGGLGWIETDEEAIYVPTAKPSLLEISKSTGELRGHPLLWAASGRAPNWAAMKFKVHGNRVYVNLGRAAYAMTLDRD